ASLSAASLLAVDRVRLRLPERPDAARRPPVDVSDVASLSVASLSVTSLSVAPWSGVLADSSPWSSPVRREVERPLDRLRPPDRLRVPAPSSVLLSPVLLPSAPVVDAPSPAAVSCCGRNAE